MITSDQKSTRSSARSTPLEKEQFLCNEALRTGDFDAISDNEWVALCERAASNGRLAAENGDQSESVLVR